MNNHYMLISVALLILSMVPMMYKYEKKKPRAREIVMVAIMSALTIVANLVCAYTVPLHAGTALVIIAGIGLGPQTGFLVGALSRFVCNFFMGQGAWTPWEMVAWGLLGALAGVAFNKAVLGSLLDDRKEVHKAETTDALKVALTPCVVIAFFEIAGYLVYLFTAQAGESFLGYRVYVCAVLGIVVGLILQRRRLPANVVTMTVFTFVTVFVLYGGIMNLGTFFMTASAFEGGIEGLKLLYITGIGYDAIHALTAAACVFLMGERIVQKLERVKRKYIER